MASKQIIAIDAVLAPKNLDLRRLWGAWEFVQVLFLFLSFFCFFCTQLSQRALPQVVGKLRVARGQITNSNKNLPLGGGVISIVFREQQSRGRPVSLCDDPEFDSLGGGIRRQKAKALFEKPSPKYPRRRRPFFRPSTSLLVGQSPTGGILPPRVSSPAQIFSLGIRSYLRDDFVGQFVRFLDVFSGLRSPRSVRLKCPFHALTWVEGRKYP